MRVVRSAAEGLAEASDTGLAFLALAFAAAVVRWGWSEMRAWRLDTRLALATDRANDASADRVELLGQARSSARVTSRLHTLIGRALSEASSFEQGAVAAVRTLCEELSWQLGEVWWRHEEFGVLHLAGLWHAPLAELEGHGAEREAASFSRGAALPGRIWAEGCAIETDAASGGDPWWQPLAERGFRLALGIPIRRAGTVLGVVMLATKHPDRATRLTTEVMDGLIGTIADFAEQRRTQEALRRTEARRQAVLDSALDCIVTYDHEGRILEFNPAAERLFGRERADVLGQSVALLVPSQYRERQAHAIARTVAGDDDLVGRRIEFEGLRSDETTFPMEMSIVQLDSGSRPTFTVYARDITERNELDRLKDELVATVSHELRTPLASLRGFVELMLVRDYPPDEQRRFLGIIDEEVKRLNRLIDDFLDVQRIESGPQAWTFQMEDVEALVRDAAEVAAATSREHSVEVVVPKSTPEVRLDRDRTYQAVLNLLSNAIKYSPDGGRVEIRVHVADEHVEIEVTDEGMGMSEEALEKVFSKFFRDDAAAARQIGGTGLGLSLVKAVAEAHGGSVEARSEIDRGSRFILRLPIAGPA